MIVAVLMHLMPVLIHLMIATLMYLMIVAVLMHLLKVVPVVLMHLMIVPNKMNLAKIAILMPLIW